MGEPRGWPPVLIEFLNNPRNKDVQFDRNAQRFLYRDQQNRARHAPGLTLLIQRAFWPSYDRTNKALMAQIAKVRAEERKEMQRRRRRSTTASVGTSWNQAVAIIRGRGAGTSNAWHGVVGKERGTIVHKHLWVYGMDRFDGTTRFSTLNPPAHPYAVAAIAKLTQLGVSVVYPEMAVIDSRVPVATAIDLVGWHTVSQSLVLIEVKTGYRYDRHMGCGPMVGPTLTAMKFNDSPFNQAVVQLMTTFGIVTNHYGIAPNRTRGLILWIDESHGAQSWWLRDIVPQPIATRSVTLLGDLARWSKHRHMQKKMAARGGHEKPPPHIYQPRPAIYLNSRPAHPLSPRDARSIIHTTTTNHSGGKYTGYYK